MVQTDQRLGMQFPWQTDTKGTGKMSRLQRECSSHQSMPLNTMPPVNTSSLVASSS